MEMFSDDFISYSNEVHVKLEKSSDHEISLDSPSIKTCESTPNLNPLNFSPSLQSLLIRSVSLAGQPVKKSQPFTIIKATREDSESHVEVKIESEDRILNKSKLILKREKAKQRAMTKLNKPIYLKLEADVESEVPDTSTNAGGEGKNKKKVLQMIRNRISAQTSRDRKKAYLHQLEDAKNKLFSDNLALKQQNSSLLQELSTLKETNKKLLLQNEELRGETGLNPISAFGESNLFSQELNNSSIETIIKKVINCSNLNDPENSNKNKLNDVCTFATVLSTLVLNQIDSTGSKGGKVNVHKDELQEESPNKFDLKAIFNRMNNDDSLFNYTNDFISDKQNTIFQHLTDMSKTDKKQLNKSAKENYNSNHSIFSLTNFDLTETGDYISLKDVKQEDIQYSFGL